ncbi:MAG: YdaU family protein [Acidobacteria bacterium]|nr:YdaU family protein [Acidobacteriota bacterium]
MNLPRMSLHIGDYRKDTGHLRAAQHGAYLLLIMHYWTKGGLPNDDRQLAAIACMTDREWKASRPILADFFGPRWFHKRIDEELAKAQEAYERRAAAGQKGGAAKAASKQCSSNAKPELGAMLKQPLTLTPLPDGSSRVESAGAGLSDEAGNLVGEILIAAKQDPEGLLAIGGHYQIQTWLNQGVPLEVIRIACVSAARKAKGTIKSWNYFTDAVTREWATAQQPLPKVEITESEVIHVNRSTRAPSAWDAAGERVLAVIRGSGSGDTGPDYEGNSRSGPREIDARLLSKG